MAKYYKVVLNTCYCGEEEYHYLALQENETLEDYIGVISSFLAEFAFEYYDGQAEEDFEGDFDAYRGECSYSIREINKQEYIQYKDN